jgi:hypothetical protein
MKKKTSRRRVDVTVEELDRVIDETEKGPLSEADREKLRTTLHALVESLERRRNTEKTVRCSGTKTLPRHLRKGGPNLARTSLPGMAAMVRTRFVAPKR